MRYRLRQLMRAFRNLHTMLFRVDFRRLEEMLSWHDDKIEELKDPQYIWVYYSPRSRR